MTLANQSVAPSKRSLLYTPRQLWSDGIHFVRPASVKDRHPMRFVVGAHKTTASLFSRHAATEDEAISLGRRATEKWLKANPNDKQHWTEATLPVASGEVESGTENSTTPKPTLGHNDSAKLTPQAFSTTQFNCIYANPVAQVWQRVSVEGERKTPGRRTKEGRAAQATPVFHATGECAVLLGDVPVRDPDGSVVIYPNWSLAAEFAQDLYDNADEEDRLMWKEGEQRVWATASVDVIFDPEGNGKTKPFSLYLPEYRRPVYEDRTRPLMQGDPTRIGDTINPQTALDLKEQRKKVRDASRVASFEERPLRFRSITGAIEEADRRERMLKGQTVV